ncbi:MAG: 2-dehydro-3-deoxygalactonokinase, partial [Burkholderiaceae bacterium]
GLLHDVFTARSAALLGELDLGHVAEYLSGLLIGHELVAGLKLLGARATEKPPCLIGEATLLARYAKAFEIAGAAIRTGPADASVLGLQRLARQHEASAA